MLSALTPAERDEVLTAARPRRFARGEVVFHAGDLGDALHFVVAGQVALRVWSPLGEVMLALVGPGGFFGELALISAEPESRTATAQAVEATRTLSMRRDTFLALRERRPAVERVLVEILAYRVREMNERLLEALYVPADARVIRRILALAASGDGDGRVPLTQERIGTLAGVSRATVNRVVRAAAAAGEVRLVRGGLEVLDPAGLERRAGPALQVITRR
jgi:CRP-like cAMP-binding protein